MSILRIWELKVLTPLPYISWGISFNVQVGFQFKKKRSQGGKLYKQTEIFYVDRKINLQNIRCYVDDIWVP